jgi:hypothetical protein
VRTTRESHWSGLSADRTDHAGQSLLVHGQASGVLERGDLAPFLYRLGHAQVTGVLDLVPVPGTGEALWLERGCVVTGMADPMGRLTGRRLGGLAGLRRVRYCFSAGAHTGAGSLQAGPVLHLSGWARSHLEAQLDAQCARVLLEELTGPRLSIAPGCAPPTTVCDEIDLRVVAAMQAPRPLHEIWRLARTSRFRLLSFLYFLRSVGALQFSGGPSAAASPAGPGASGPAEVGAAGQAETHQTHSPASARRPWTRIRTASARPSACWAWRRARIGRPSAAPIAAVPGPCTQTCSRSSASCSAAAWSTPCPWSPRRTSSFWPRRPTHPGPSASCSTPARRGIHLQGACPFAGPGCRAPQRASEHCFMAARHVSCVSGWA